MKKLSAYLLLLSLIIIFISACGSSDDTPAAAPTPPSTVGAQLRADAGDQEVTLYWPMVAGADTYNVYYSTSRTFTKSTGTLLKTGWISASYNTGKILTNGTTYYFAFTAVSTANGESDLSNIIPVTPQGTPIPPEFPKNVRANAGGGKVTVTWTPVAGADHYTLYCMWLSGSLDVAIGGITIPAGQTLQDVTSMNWITGTGVGTTTGLSNGTLYSFSLMAETAETSPSTVVLATTGTPTTDTKSGGAAATTITATVTAGTTGQVIISWDPLASATANTSYNIYYYPTDDGSTINDKKIPGATSPWTVYGLTNETSYSFYLTSDTASSISFAALATPSDNPPPMAPDLTVVTPGDGQVIIGWNTVPDATSYNVYSSNTMGLSKQVYGSKASGTGNSFTATGLTNDIKYFFVVTAVNANGESTESIEVWATPGTSDWGIVGQ